MKTAPKSIHPPPVAHIYRAGQTREVQPPCESLRQVLRTIAHVAQPQADQALGVVAASIRLWDEVEVIGKPGSGVLGGPGARHT